jgi:hypothetical protein
LEEFEGLIQGRCCTKGFQNLEGRDKATPSPDLSKFIPKSFCTGGFRGDNPYLPKKNPYLQKKDPFNFTSDMDSEPPRNLPRPKDCGDSTQSGVKKELTQYRNFRKYSANNHKHDFNRTGTIKISDN